MFASKEIEVEVKISKPALETLPYTIRVPIIDNSNSTKLNETFINNTSSDNSTMTVEPEEEKNSTAEEDQTAEPLPQKDIVPKEQSLKPKKKLTSSKPEPDTFMDKINKEKKKLDTNSHGVKKIDFKLSPVDPLAGKNATDEERLVVPPLKNETLKND